MNSETKAAYSVQEFCRLHSISRAMLYKLIKSGRGPKILKIGTRSLITAEAAAGWRRDMEAAA